MITPSDAFYTYDLGEYYVILPSVPNWDLKTYIKTFNAKNVEKGFHYTSENNNQWETVDSLRNLIKENIDESFEVNE